MSKVESVTTASRNIAPGSNASGGHLWRVIGGGALAIARQAKRASGLPKDTGRTQITL